MQDYLQREDIATAFANYPSSVHKKFVAAVFDCDENKKLHEFTLLLAPDGFIQYGSNPKVTGRQHIEILLIEFYKQFTHLQHHIQQVFFDSPDEVVYSADVTYFFEDGSDTGAIPYMNHLRFKGELVYDYRIYIDLSPLYKMNT